MEFSESLKKNSSFRQVYGNGKSYANRFFVMYVLKNDTERNRLGISVSKKVGDIILQDWYGKHIAYRKKNSAQVWTL